MLKDWRKVYRNLKGMHGMDEHEKVLYARSLAATPDEMWQINVAFLRSLGLWGRSSLKESHIHYIDQTLRVSRANWKKRKGK